MVASWNRAVRLSLASRLPGIHRGEHPAARRFRADRGGYGCGVRAVFAIYLVVIVAGIVGFSLLGILGR
jgi:hypothetical protein